MASRSRAVVKTLSSKERVTLIQREGDQNAKAYLILKMAVEYVCERIMLHQAHAMPVSLQLIRGLLHAGIHNAESLASEVGEGPSEPETFFCDRCHTFLTPQSESAGYCIKCESKG